MLIFVPTSRSLGFYLYMHWCFNKAKRLFSLLLGRSLLEWRHGEGEAASMGVILETLPSWTPFLVTVLELVPTTFLRLISGFPLKSTMVGAFTPWKLASAANQGSLPGELVAEHLPAHHCLWLRKKWNSYRKENAHGCEHGCCGLEFMIPPPPLMS